MAEEKSSTTNVSSPEPQLVVPPGGQVSFDQIAALDDLASAAEVKEVVATAKKEKAVEEAKKDIGENGKVSFEAKRKILKALTEDSEIEIPNNARLKHKDKEATIQDLLDSYVGQQEIHRRFSDYDKKVREFATQKKVFEEDIGLINQNLKKMAELAEKGDHWESLRFMAKMAGKDPVEYQESFVKHAMDVADEFSSMSDEEKKAFWAEQRVKYYQGELKAQKDKETKVSQSQQLENNVKSIIKSYNIDEQTFAGAYQQLKEVGAIQKLNGQTPDTITKKVCQYCHDVALESRVIEAIKKRDPDLLKNQKLVDNIFEVADYDYSVSDIADLLSEYLGSDSSDDDDDDESKSKRPSKEESSKKVLKAGSEKPTSKEKKQQKGKSTFSEDPEDVLGWDDLYQYSRRGI